MVGTLLAKVSNAAMITMAGYEVGSIMNEEQVTTNAAPIGWKTRFQPLNHYVHPRILSNNTIAPAQLLQVWLPIPQTNGKK